MCFLDKLKQIEFEKAINQQLFLGVYTVNDQPHSRGEIVISRYNVTKGYLHQDEKTREVYKTDSDGKVWFHTGDIGEVMPDGVFKVIGKLLTCLVTLVSEKCSHHLQSRSIARVNE